jgi:DNA polymerase III subunit gamma/tau
MAKSKTTKKASKSSGAASTGQAPYVVLARKYRPQTFDDLIGQDAMVQTLSNAFTTGRIAQGYMLTGVRGVGKTTTARILARALNYETDDHAAPTVNMTELGKHCAAIMESRHPDVLEMDAASNTGVDNMRELIESARYKPMMARNKIYIIDEVHMLSKGAFNALLKTLEEPPPHVKFIFATTEIRKVPVTVLSRCQRFDLRRVDVPALKAHLAGIAKSEGATADGDALGLIARAAEGSVRDALSILDQAIAMGSGSVSEPDVRAMLGLADRGRVFDLLDQLFAGAAATALKILGELYRDGADPVQLLADLAEAVHVVARTKAIGDDSTSDELSAEERRRAASLAKSLSMPVLARAWQMLSKGLTEAQLSPNPMAAAEMVLIRLAYVADLPSPEELIKGLDGQPMPARQTAPAPAADKSSQDALLSAQAVPDLPETESARGGAVAQSPGPVDTAPALAAISSDIDSPQTFTDVVRLATAKRDVKLAMHLEEHVSVVKFDAAGGAIDLFLLDDAPSTLANELREKLNRWTGRNWMVVLSAEKGALPLAMVRRQEEAAALEALKADPAVAAIFDVFPGAKLIGPAPKENDADDDSATG